MVQPAILIEDILGSCFPGRNNPIASGRRGKTDIPQMTWTRVNGEAIVTQFVFPAHKFKKCRICNDRVCSGHIGLFPLYFMLEPQNHRIAIDRYRLRLCAVADFETQKFK